MHGFEVRGMTAGDGPKALSHMGTGLILHDASPVSEVNNPFTGPSGQAMKR
jgi:hypothetical protein